MFRHIFLIPNIAQFAFPDACLDLRRRKVDAPELGKGTHPTPQILEFVSPTPDQFSCRDAEIPLSMANNADRKGKLGGVYPRALSHRHSRSHRGS